MNKVPTGWFCLNRGIQQALFETDAYRHYTFARIGCRNLHVDCAAHRLPEALYATQQRMPTELLDHRSQ